MKIRIKETPHDEEITTTIKPLDREDSNAELEKGEIVFDPNRLTLHKVLGKRHYAGGTPVNLDPGSFIFSDYKKLALKKRDVELMEFKKGGTPAKVLSREVNIKHHNTMIDMLLNQKGDEVSNNSAELMIQKNLERTGQIAFLQEEKKRFPQGQPSFSQGTAPVYSPEIDIEMAKSKQYQIGGPFLGASSSMPFMNVDYECPCGRAANGQCLPCPDNDPRANPYFQTARRVSQAPGNYGLIGRNNGSTLYSNSTIPNRRLMTDQQWLNYLSKETPEQKQRRLQRQRVEADDRFVRIDPNDGILPPRVNTPEERLRTTPGIPSTVTPRVPTTSPANPNLPVVARYPKIGLTDYQKLDLGRQAIAALSVKRYDPIRQQQESVITQPELFSAQPYLNQINQGYFNASSNLRTLTNPSQLTAANRELYGNRLDQANNVIGNIENQNVSLLNQSRQNNANILNQDAQQNRQYDLDYYNNTVLSRQNYNNLRDIATDNLFNGFNETIGEVQAMQNMINSQRPVRTDVPIRDRNGNIIAYEGQLPILPQRGFFGYSTRYNPNISAEGVLNYNTGIAGNSTNLQQQLLSELNNLKTQIENTVDERAKAAMTQSYWTAYQRLLGLNVNSRR